MSSESNQINLPKGWVKTRLGDILEVIRGASPRPKGDPRYFGGEIPWIMIADVTKQKGKYLYETRDSVTNAGAELSRYLESDTLILTNSGTVCVPKILAVPGCIHDGFVAFPNMSANLDKLYLYHYFHFIRQRVIQENRQGVTQVNLNTTIIKNLEILFPPLEEQKRIVKKLEALLSELDKATESLKAAQEKLKFYRRSVLKAAVEGRLSKAWREQNKDVEPAGKLLERILVERRRRWEENELAKMREKGKEPKDDKWKKKYFEPDPPDANGLPELPESWVWVNVGQLMWFVRDGPHYSPKYSAEGIPFITGGHVRPTGVDFENAKFISPELHDELSKRCKPEKNDILYTKGGTTGIARVNTYDHEFNVWVHVAVLKLASIELIDPFFVQYMLNSPFCYTQAQNFTHGVGNQDLGLTRMVNIILPLLSKNEQKVIIQELDQYISLIDNLEKTIRDQLEQSEIFRQSILKEAFSGQLVPQDPTDEPASVLLEHIRAEREQAETTKGKGKRRKTVQPKLLGESS